jgi:hypothetical protein
MSDDKQESVDNTKKAEIVVDGKKVEITKLKAGKFYEAQKVFSDIIKSMSSSTEEIPNNPQEIAEKAEKVDSTQLDAIMTVMPKKVAEFVAICAGMTVDEFLEKAYPEEIPTAFTICYKLNNVTENLKNFRTPLVKLGGEFAESK